VPDAAPALTMQDLVDVARVRRQDATTADSVDRAKLRSSIEQLPVKYK